MHDMAYVNGFAHDVFLSYSTIDNELLVKDGRGWVDVLLDTLCRELRPRLGARELAIFIDHETMRSNLPITTQLIEAAQNSATLLVVMSPSYLRSSWCDQERRAFLDAVKARVAGGSMLVVRARPVDGHEQPDEFRDLRGIEFFASVPGAAGHRVLGAPDPCEPSFCDRIVALAGELALQLKRVPAPPPTRTSVFIAQATDDLEYRELELRSYLDQAGLKVLPSPQSRYPTTNLAVYEAALLHELETCALFAQVLSPVQGKRRSFADGKRLPALQHALALRANKLVLQWRDRDLAIDAVEDDEHRALLEAAQVCSFEEFKRTVADHAKTPNKPTPPPARASEVAVFVVAAAQDHRLASEVSAALTGLGATCLQIDWTGSPSDIRTEMETNLRECDGLIVIYGETELLWIHEQLRYARRLKSTRQAPAIVVLDGPPSDKPDVPRTAVDLNIVKCRDGVDPEQLRPFVSRLQK